MSIMHGKIVTADPQAVLLAGNATFGSSGAVSSAVTPGFAFADSGTTGIYNVTVDEKYTRCLAIVPSFDNNSVETVNSQWQIEEEYDASTGVIKLAYVNDIGGTEAYADPPSGSEVNLIAVFTRGVARPSST